MKKTLFFVAVAIVMITIIACGGKSHTVPIHNGDSLAIANADPTVYGVCGVETTMNELQLVTDNGDTLMLDLSAAIENGKFFGGLQVGDRMAVVPNADRTAAVMAINQSTLMGNWVMPNPLDGSDEVGIRIKEGGIAESIDQTSIDYRTWRLVRGQLEVVLVREDGGEEEEICLYDIIKLGPDSLVFKDADDTYEYSRQRPKEEYGKDVKLEESSLDDFKM